MNTEITFQGNEKSNDFVKGAKVDGCDTGRKETDAGITRETIAGPFTCVPSGFQDVIKERKRSYH